MGNDLLMVIEDLTVQAHVWETILSLNFVLTDVVVLTTSVVAGCFNSTKNPLCHQNTISNLSNNIHIFNAFILSSVLPTVNFSYQR